MDHLVTKTWSFAVSLSICSLFLTFSTVAVAAPAVCMIKKTKGNPVGDHDFTLVMPQSSVAEMTRRGFKQRGCGRRIGTAPKVARQMCALAEKNLPGVDASFAQQYSVTPAEICAMANGVSTQ